MINRRTLVIVESPAKCNKIESFLGATEYKVMASFGHLREIAGGLKAIDIPNHYRPSFQFIETKKENIQKLKTAIQYAKAVIIATDDDREGEAIAWHLCDSFGLPVETTPRIIFHEITKSAIQHAIANPVFLNMRLVDAQKARQVLDILVGFKISPVLYRHFSYRYAKSLSAGRCQTPALRIIYENQIDIERAGPGSVYTDVVAYFTKLHLPYALSPPLAGDDPLAVESFLQASKEKDVHRISIGDPKPGQSSPPLPFTTSGLQQAASNSLRYSPKQTMELAQELYENGFITYMRTDATTYSDEFLLQAKKYVVTCWGEPYWGFACRKNVSDGVADNDKKINNKKKAKTVAAAAAAAVAAVIQQPHEAIRPTNIETIDLPEGHRARSLYKLIWTRTLESCMTPSTHQTIHTTITSPLQAHLYHYTATKIIFPGWKAVSVKKHKRDDYDNDNDREGDGEETANPQAFEMFLYLQSGVSLPFNKIQAKNVLKHMKSHLTEAKLVKLLEDKGIGRPSTFSSIVEKLKSRDYVRRMDVPGVEIDVTEWTLESPKDPLYRQYHKKTFGAEKNKLVLQSLGRLVWEFLRNHFEPLFQYEFTKNMEDSLDKIATGNKNGWELCSECDQEIEKYLAKTSSLHKLRIPIDDRHVYTIGKYGPVIEQINETVDDSKKSKSKSKKAEAEAGEEKQEKVFLPVIPNVDLIRLQNGGYTLDQLICRFKQQDPIGKYKDGLVYIKSGKYGIYAEYQEKGNKNDDDDGKDMDDKEGEEEEQVDEELVASALQLGLDEVDPHVEATDYLVKDEEDVKNVTKISLKGLKKDIDQITMKDILPYLEKAFNKKENGIVRRLDKYTDIREGKYGPFVFHQTPTMKKPKFVGLKDFREGYLHCDLESLWEWLEDNHGITNS